MARPCHRGYPRHRCRSSVDPPAGSPPSGNYATDASTSRVITTRPSSMTCSQPGVPPPVSQGLPTDVRTHNPTTTEHNPKQPRQMSHVCSMVVWSSPTQTMVPGE